MPELPDITVYLDALDAARPGPDPRDGFASATRSWSGPSSRRPTSSPASRVAASTAWASGSSSASSGDSIVIVHLMIAGRFRWRDRGREVPGKLGLAAFDFPTGTLILTEAGSSGGPRSISSAAKRLWPRSIRAGSRSSTADAGRSSRARLTRREPHAQARPHRSPHLQRHRQRLLRRDPARGAAVADEAHPQPCPTTRSRGSSTPRARR